MIRKQNIYKKNKISMKLHKKNQKPKKNKPIANSEVNLQEEEEEKTKYEHNNN